ncbi:MAG: hypothetical protein ACRCZ2_13625 [Fusobacteriaceae bacterium]
MFGSLKTAYLTKRGYKIQFINEIVEANKLVKSTAVITKDSEEYQATVTVEQLKNGKQNGGLQNAPMTKVRYEALNRILKTQLSGIIPDLVSRSEDDIIDIVETKVEAKTPTVEDELLKFIKEECPDFKSLLKVKDKCNTDELKQAYNLKLKELQPAQTVEVLEAEIDDYADLITKPQISKLHACLSDFENKDEIKAGIKSKYEVDSTKDLTKAQAIEAIEYLEDLKKSII